MKIRVKFRKEGPIRYIGHLDVMRYFQKAIRRAEIDVAYTAGFSPHQIMSFAAPLGVGLESNGEYMDIECNSVSTSQDMIDRLNRVGAPGIEVIGVKMPLNYLAEMVMDRIAACKIYQGKNYTDDMPYAYFARSKEYITMHPETKEMLDKILKMLKEKGEKKTFAYIRRLLKQGTY